jgi:hypothetical protein
MSGLGITLLRVSNTQVFGPQEALVGLLRAGLETGFNNHQVLRVREKMTSNYPFHPTQFQVNEAWIAFKLNDAPIHTERDGDFNFVALMDAASCFILGSTPVPAGMTEPSRTESSQLLKQGHVHRRQWPKTLFIPAEQPARHLSEEAERHGIAVVRVAEDQLMHFIGEAREGFRERFESVERG